MGSPMDPIANAFLRHYEKEWLNNCLIHFKPMIYKRHADDIFVIFSSKKHLQLFADYMNKPHKCLQYPSETENDNSFPFLDIKLPVIINNSKHLFIENQVSVVYLGTMKVI